MKTITSFIILYLLISCNKDNYKEIEFGNTLVENQTYAENKKLIEAVERTIKLDNEGLIELININCGGAAGCYDLGDIITQIIHKVGEDNFLVMVKKLNSQQKNDLKNFIEVGLEYGKIKPKIDFKNTWPKLNTELNK